MNRRRLALVAALLLAITAVACQPRLGSRTNGFGNQLTGDLNGNGTVQAGECIDPQSVCAGTQPLLWGAISNPSWGRNQGDPYTATCPTGFTCGWNPSTPNPERRRDGYLYGIEVAEAGQTVTVELYDAPVNSASSATADLGSFPVQYELFADDGDDLTTRTDAGLSLAGRCRSGPGRRGFPGAYDPSTYKNRWWTLCTFTAAAPGVYPLRVTSTDLVRDTFTGVTACTDCTTVNGSTTGAAVSSGVNMYAIRAVANSGTAPRVYGLGDVSVFMSASYGSSVMDLVEVTPASAGDRLVVDVFDPGDGGGTVTMDLIDATGGIPPCVLAIGGLSSARTAPPISTIALEGGCSFPTASFGSSLYDGKWVRMSVDLPQEITCDGPDCWWQLRVTSTQTTNERLTVSVHFDDLQEPA